MAKTPDHREQCLNKPIYDRPIDHAGAWYGNRVSKQAVTVDLDPAQRGALERMLKHFERDAVELGDIRRQHCGHPQLDDVLARIFHEIQHGRGLVILRGVPTNHPVADVAKMLWAIGTHLGVAVSQNSKGSILGYVRDETPKGQAESVRGYRSRRELALHNDFAAIVGLMCVRPASSGGESQLVSALALHNEFLANRPDLLPVMYEGFHHHRLGEQAAGLGTITPFKVPTFSNIGGTVSVFRNWDTMTIAARESNIPFTPQQAEANDYFDETARRIQFEFRLEAGEVAFFNNYTVLHSRKGFQDHEDEDKKRLMLRLWLDVPGGRPIPREFNIYENAGGNPGIDAPRVTVNQTA